MNVQPRRQQISADDLSSGQIEEIQIALGEAGFDVGPVDGNWGPSTRQSLENFQEFSRLMVTGELNRQTLQELGVDIQPGQQREQAGQMDRQQRFAEQDRFQQRDCQDRQQAGQMDRQQRFAQQDRFQQQDRQDRQVDRQMGQQQANFYVQQDMIGQQLRSQDGERVGEIVDIALDRQGRRINEYIVELDDGTTVAVSSDEVRRNRQTNRLTAQMSAQELRNMEEFAYEETVGMGTDRMRNRMER